MFPKRITTSITIYHRNPPSGIAPEGISCVSIDGAFWDDTKSVKANKSGHEPSADTIIYIPFETGASLDIHPNDVIVKGVGENVESISDISNGVKVMKVKDRCVGSRNMWHWEVHCK